MPQLDSLTYFTQSFWFVLLFLAFYLVIANEIVPHIALILKTRAKLLKSGLNSSKVTGSKADIETLILSNLK